MERCQLALANSNIETNEQPWRATASLCSTSPKRKRLNFSAFQRTRWRLGFVSNHPTTGDVFVGYSTKVITGSIRCSRIVSNSFLMSNLWSLINKAFEGRGLFFDPFHCRRALSRSCSWICFEPT